MWYHYGCFWRKAKVSGESEVHGIEKLRWDDQEKIRLKISQGPQVSSAASSKVKLVEPILELQYAKNSAAKCKICGEKIIKVCIKCTQKFSFIVI